MRRAALYVRCSTADQEHGLDAQLDELRRYAAARDWEPTRSTWTEQPPAPRRAVWPWTPYWRPPTVGSWTSWW